MDLTFGKSIEVGDEIEVGGDAHFKQNVRVDGELDVYSDITVSGDILPMRGYSSSIGSITRPFKDIYIQSSTLYFVNEIENSFDNPTVNSLSVINGRLELSIVDTSTNELTSNIKVGSSFVNKREDKSYYDLITQQPPIFTKDTSIYTDSYSNTTKDLTIYWHYDDIIAYMTDTSYQAFYNNDSTYNRIIPYINNLYVDISYSTVTNGWQNYVTIPINSDYNVSQYKSNTITRKQAPPSGNSYLNTLLFQEEVVEFDVRVYGSNLGYNYPTVEERALIYNNVTFKQPDIPGVFNFNNSTINTPNSLTLSYNYTEPEAGNANSTAILQETQTKYTENDTLSSSYYPLVTTVREDIETDEPITGGNDFTVGLSSLRAGTKYDFLTRIRNDLNSNFTISDSSWNLVGTDVPFDTVNGPTLYTSLPTDHSYSSDYNPILTYKTTESITTPIIDNSEVTYINISDTQKIVPTYTYVQSFEISDTNATTNDQYGYGKYIETSNSLVELSLYVNNNVKQTLSYPGFSPSSQFFHASKSVSTTTIDYYDNPLGGDIYVNNSLKRGYRLWGNFQMTNINTNDVVTAVGSPSSAPYVLKHELTRDTNLVGGTASASNTTNVYVDDLPNNPNISQQTETAIVTDVVWTMGIPSVKKYKIECTRTYSDINSQYQYIRGDRKLSSINSVTSTSNTSNSTDFTTGVVYIDSNNISTDGSYSYTVSEFANAITNKLDDLHYTIARNSSNTNVTINEIIYSLKSNGITKNVNVTVNHHFDKNSYNNLGSSLSTKLSLTDIHELDASTISKINNDLGGLVISTYSSHMVIPNNWTLLYYNGLFQTTGYPNVPDYEWDNVAGTLTYNAGGNGLSLTGTEETSGTRYKWIVFKLNKITSTQYKFNNKDYYLLDTGGIKYLSVTDILSNSGLFNSATINNLFNSNNTDIIGFCRVTKTINGSNIPYIGNLKVDFSPTGGNWTLNGSSQTGYTNSLNQSYGSRVYSGTEYGFYIAPASVNDDLTMFIGLKL